MNSNYPPCPECGGRHFKVSKLPYPGVLFYVLNPAIAVNEILLGQCAPKITLYCQTCQLPLYARSYVPCPHCKTMNNGLLWSKKRAFGHWFGLICPKCRLNIPRLWNIFSIIILIILAPIWYFPYRFLAQKNQASRKNLRYRDVSKIKHPTRKNWFFMGAGYGFFMWIFLSLIPEIIDLIKNQIFSLSNLLIDAFVFSLSGFVFGLLMYLILTRKPN